MTRVRDIITNYCLKSLLSVDAPHILPQHHSCLLSAVSSVVEVNQTDFLPGRNSGCNIFTLQLVHDNENLISDILVPVDLEKADSMTSYDSVQLCFERFGFGPALPP